MGAEFQGGSPEPTVKKKNQIKIELFERKKKGKNVLMKAEKDPSDSSNLKPKVPSERYPVESVFNLVSIPLVDSPARPKKKCSARGSSSRGKKKEPKLKKRKTYVD